MPMPYRRELGLGTCHALHCAAPACGRVLYGPDLLRLLAEARTAGWMIEEDACHEDDGPLAWCHEHREESE